MIQNHNFTFIDLFAGIGGFRLACEGIGGTCVFSSEWDKHAQQTYFHNFGEIPYGDITQEETKKHIPQQFDLLCAGFPCQPFSVAGYRKGFEDTRGTLFFEIANIIEKYRPKSILLENVKNLRTHNKGETFAVIKQTLRQLNYAVFSKVMNAMEYANIPQNRERVFIVAFDKTQIPNYEQFFFPSPMKLTRDISTCINYKENDERLFYSYKMAHYVELQQKIISQSTIYQWRRTYVRENKNGVCPTLTANMGTGGHNVPLILTDDKRIRKLSPKECLAFLGFPLDYSFPNTIPLSACYKQAGNSVVVPLIKNICQQIYAVIKPNL